MSQTLPTTPGFKTINLESIQAFIQSESESGIRQTRLTGGHHWEISIKYPPLTQAEFAPIDAVVMALDGGFDDLVVTWPIANQGTWISSSPSINGAVAAGSTSINVDGLTAGSTTITPGDIFTGGHSKVYKVITGGTAGANSDVLMNDGASFILLNDGSSHILMDESGQVTCEIRPATNEIIADNQAITNTSVQFTMAVVGSHKFNTFAPTLYNYQIDLRESF